MKKGVDYIGVSVGAIIVNDKGEVLLTKRTNKTRNEHGKWEEIGWFSLDKLPSPISYISSSDLKAYKKYLANRGGDRVFALDNWKLML